MLYRFFRFFSSVASYVFEELLDNNRTKARLEPTFATIKDLDDEKELPPIKFD